MSASNLDLVRSIYADWERGDFTSAEWAHAEIEWVVADGPAPGSWTGLAGMAQALRDQLSAWEEARAHADEYRELDDERVLVLEHRHGSGKTSGIDISELHARSANLFLIRAGKVIKLVMYWDRDRALADLGLAPD